MSKRSGPAPKGEHVGKSAVFSTRIRADLRAQLDAAAKTSGRSLSQEVENRLRSSFKYDERLADQFGSVRDAFVMKLIASALQVAAKNPERPNVSWLDDPTAFRQAMRTLGAVLEAIRPEGVPSEKALRGSDAWAPYIAAQNLWADIERADASLPFNATKRQLLANAVKNRMPDIVQRISVRREADMADLHKRTEALKSKSRGKKR